MEIPFFCVCFPVRRYPLAALHWSSGYDARLTRERSPVQSWDEVFIAITYRLTPRRCESSKNVRARLAQLVERKALNLVVVGPSPTVGVLHPAARALKSRAKNLTTVGLEPTIFGSEDRRLIHWATRPIGNCITRLAVRRCKRGASVA